MGNNVFDKAINETIDKGFQFGFENLEPEETRLLEDTFLQTYLYRFGFINDVFVERMSKDKIDEFIRLYNSGESMGDIVETFFRWYNENWRLIDWAYPAYTRKTSRIGYTDDYGFSLCCPPNNGVYRMKISISSGRISEVKSEVKEEE